MHQHGGDIYNHNHVLDFSSNINFLGTPKKVLEAACQGVLGSHVYPDIQCRALREAISVSEGVAAEHILCGNGAADLIFSLVHAVAPTKALVLSPTFHEYEQALQSVSCQITYHELSDSRDFLLGEDFLTALTPDLDLVFLCNPNNPTGQLIPGGLLEAILFQCRTHNTLLVVDECFLDLVSDGEVRSMKPYLADHPNLFVLKAFTKLYAIPGLRLGYGLCSDTNLLMRIRECSQPWNVSLPAQLAGIAATNEQEYVRDSLAALDLERRYLLSELNTLPVQVYGSAANYIFFSIRNSNRTTDTETDHTVHSGGSAHKLIDTGEPQGIPSLSLYEECLSRGILIRDCSNYRGLGDGYYRIAIRSHADNQALIHTLKEVF